MKKFEDVRFLNLSREEDIIKYSDPIAKLTHRSKRDLFYLLFQNKKSYAFCIIDGEAVVGFQGFVYKPVIINGEMVPTFRSEFTIATSELRGTGLFPKFYKYTMDVIKRDHKEVYFWGETSHKGWINFGFRMIKRYTFYQIFSKKLKEKVRKPEIFNQLAINTLCVLFSVVNPFRYFLRKPIKVHRRITYHDFKFFELKSKKFKLRLYMDEEIFQWRYIENDFQTHLFLVYRESLLIVQEKASQAIIVDIYAKNVVQYLFLITYLMRKYAIVIMHGNLYALSRTPYFWLNLLVGFSTFLGGGSFVECNQEAKRICWRDIPLLEAWWFGV